jgi:hypothetical protein
MSTRTGVDTFAHVRRGIAATATMSLDAVEVLKSTCFSGDLPRAGHAAERPFVLFKGQA